MNFLKFFRGLLVESVDPRTAETVVAVIDLYRTIKGNEWLIKKVFGDRAPFGGLPGFPLFKFDSEMFDVILETDPSIKKPKNVKLLEDLFNFIYTDPKIAETNKIPYWANAEYFRTLKKQVEDYLSSDRDTVYKAPFGNLVEKVNKTAWLIKKNMGLGKEDAIKFFTDYFVGGVQDPEVVQDLVELVQQSLKTPYKNDKDIFFEYVVQFLKNSKLLKTFFANKKEIEAVLKKAENDAVAALKDFPAEVPEADIDIVPWGKIAFAPSRTGVPAEKNTREEDKVEQAFIAHIQEDDPLTASTSKKLSSILSKGWYNSVIKEPEQEYIFRGMRGEKSWFERTGIFDGSEADQGSKEISYSFTPGRGGKSGASSWTISVDVARDFSKASSGEFSVILVAKKSENPGKFIVGKNGFYKLIDLADFSYEEEAIALGEIKVEKIYWEKNDEKSDKGYEGTISEE